MNAGALYTEEQVIKGMRKYAEEVIDEMVEEQDVLIEKYFSTQPNNPYAWFDKKKIEIFKDLLL